jgi:hypothetical protein
MRKPQTSGIFHNPGYDFYRAVYFMASESTEVPTKLVAPYFRPIVALLCACASIEGYVHTCAQRADSSWRPQARARESLKNRITRAYALIGQTVDFSTQPFKDIMDLFAWRNRLLHPVLQWDQEKQKKPVRDIFDDVASHFPLERLLALTDAFRKHITKAFGLRDTWCVHSTNLTIYDLPDEVA